MYLRLSFRFPARGFQAFCMRLARDSAAFSNVSLSLSVDFISVSLAGSRDIAIVVPLINVQLI